MRYVLLLRGINMVGRNTLIMSEFVATLTEFGLENVQYYINSGNVFFDSTMIKNSLYNDIKDILNKQYNLGVDFVLLTAEQLKEEHRNLPEFWYNDNCKREVLFFMPDFNVNEFKELSKNWQLIDENIHIGNTALFWVGNKHLSIYRHTYLKTKFLKNLSIRKGATFEMIMKFL